MDLHPKKKIEIIVEKAIVKTVLSILRDNGATGVTVLQVLSGEGHSGDWSDKDLGSAMDMQMIMTVTGPRRATVIKDAVHEALTNYRGMIMISDVEVIRNEHF